MTNFLLFLLALVVLVVGYIFYRHLAVISAMGTAVNLVKLGLFRRLKHRYSTILDVPDATLLADAVTAFIFSEEPTEPHEVRFKVENKERIDREARSLSQDTHICQIITQAVRTQATIAHSALKQNAGVVIEQLERLSTLGILVKGGESPSPDTFIPAARAFCDGESSLDTPASSPAP